MNTFIFCLVLSSIFVCFVDTRLSSLNSVDNRSSSSVTDFVHVVSILPFPTPSLLINISEINCDVGPFEDFGDGNEPYRSGSGSGPLGQRCRLLLYTRTSGRGTASRH